jgi:hypothetical protein
VRLIKPISAQWVNAKLQNFADSGIVQDVARRNGQNARACSTDHLEQEKSNRVRFDTVMKFRTSFV